jgi:large subunit ribosomal protein L16
MRGLARAGNELAYGSYGIQALGRGRITNIQIEACRIAITRSMKRKGKLWIRIFPDKPVTAKPLEVRMGKGKGNVENWVAVVKPGRVLFEVDGVAESIAIKGLRLAATKLAMPTRYISRTDNV